MTHAKHITVRCLARKLEVLCDEFEAARGPNTFVGSPEWRATLHQDWRDGTCLREAGHAGNCEFTDDVRRDEKERKAS